MPYIEQNNLHDQIDFKFPCFDLQNLPARETQLKVFMCPTDQWSDHNFVVRDESANPVERYAAASYCANWGPAISPLDTSGVLNLDDTPDQSGGPFYRNSKIKFGNITDGTSNTLAVGERTNGPILDLDGKPIGHPPHPNFENVWFAAARAVEDQSDDHGHMVLFEAGFAPNQARGDDGADRGVSAPHAGLAQFSFLDGSVHTISANIEIDVYRALASIRGGEVIPDEY